jgi:tryptophan synthase alpha chain
MKTIDAQLAHIKKTKKIGLMTHVVIGFPSVEATIQLVKEMAASGVDFIELQIPFSDPLADGPTIMHANDIALAGGITREDCFRVMEELSAAVDIPLLFMGYYQTVFRTGVEEFCRRARAAGAQGLIIPDIPIDEEGYEHFLRACKKHKLCPVRLFSPTSTEERIKLNAAVQSGFVYCTSRSGTTGANNEIDPSLVEYLNTVRKYIHVPIAVGFGISKPEHVAALVGQADIAVVGSAVIDLIEKQGVAAVPQYIKHLLSQAQRDLVS